MDKSNFDSEIPRIWKYMMFFSVSKSLYNVITLDSKNNVYCKNWIRKKDLK